MTPTPHRTGTVTSGDVGLFYRHFGRPGAEPILILHGAGYYDSADWIDVAAALATDREVVAYDARGYGRSTWSPSRDYSLDAQIADIAALTDHLEWERPVLLGHSRGGSFTLRYAHSFPERVGGVILADSCPGRTARGPAPAPAPGDALPDDAPAPEQPVYPTLADALASTSRDPASIDRPEGRARLEQFFTPAPGGGVVLSARDPAFGHERPLGQPDWATRFPPIDLWAALAGLEMRLLIIRAVRSLSFDAASVQRVRDSVRQARYVEIESGHDLAGEAPSTLIDAVSGFLTGQDDSHPKLQTEESVSA